MTTLQLIIKKAKALKAAAPKKYAKWTDYVKAASATIKPKKKATVSGVKKKATKKVVKKAAPKKAAKKSTSYHKDTKSHNVRINVVSGVKNKYSLTIDKGINEFYVDKLKKLTEELATAEKRKYLLDIEWKKGDKNFKERNLIFKKHWPTRIKMLKKMITETKRYIK